MLPAPIRRAISRGTFTRSAGARCYHFHPFCLVLFVTAHLEAERQLGEVLNAEMLAAALAGRKPN